ncbi:MAG: hypothetical protein V3W44_08445 [Dehalococcoidales bacterium]
MDILEQMEKVGTEISSHCSDLYVPVTEETTKIVAEYKFKGNVTRFRSQVDGKPWFDIPFAYTPYWENRLK